MRILVGPRTPSAIVDAAVEALRPTTAAEFSKRAQDEVESVLRECQVSFPQQKAKYLVGAAEVCASAFGGDVPRRPRDMRKLPGVGEKGAAQLCVSAWGCDDGGVVVGTSTHRACNALGWVETSTPTETKRALEAWFPREIWRPLPVLVGAHVAAPAPAVFDPLLGRGVAVFLPPGHRDRDAVVAACALLGGGGGAREYRIHRSKFDADAPDELLASARVDSYGAVEAVVEDLRARRISCYARRVVDDERRKEVKAGRNARALQKEEHGRRAVGARGVPGDLRDVSLVINTTTTLDTRALPAAGSAPSAAAR